MFDATELVKNAKAIEVVHYRLCHNWARSSAVTFIRIDDEWRFRAFHASDTISGREDDIRMRTVRSLSCEDELRKIEYESSAERTRDRWITKEKFGIGKDENIVLYNNCARTCLFCGHNELSPPILDCSDFWSVFRPFNNFDVDGKAIDLSGIIKSSYYGRQAFFLCQYCKKHVEEDKKRPTFRDYLDYTKGLSYTGRAPWKKGLISKRIEGTWPSSHHCNLKASASRYVRKCVKDGRWKVASEKTKNFFRMLLGVSKLNKLTKTCN